MRMIFRCDPALVGSFAAAGARAQRAARLAARDAGESAFGNPRPRHPHRQAMPALCRRDGLWRDDPASLRRQRSIAARSRGTGIFRSPRRQAIRARRLSFHVAAQFADAPFAKGRQAAIKFNSFWTIELEAGLVAVCHPSGQPRRPAVSPDLGAGRCRSLPRRRHQFPRDLDESRIFPACCRRARRWRSASRCRAPRHSSSSRVLMRRTNRPIRRPSPKCSAAPNVYRKHFRARRGRLEQERSRNNCGDLD